MKYERKFLFAIFLIGTLITLAFSAIADTTSSPKDTIKDNSITNDSPNDDIETDNINTNNINKPLLNEKDREELRIKREEINKKREELRNDLKEKINETRKAIEKNTELRNKIAAKAQEHKLKMLEKISDNNKNFQELMNKLDNKTLEKLSLMSRNEMKKILENNADKIKSKLSEMKEKKAKVSDFLMKRKIAKEKLDLINKQINITKEKFAEAKKEYLSEKNLFDKAVKSGNETAAIEHAKKFLNSLADTAINNLNEVKEKVNSNDDFTDSESADITNDIDLMIKELNDAKTKLDAAKTKDEIKTLGKQITQAWNKSRNKIAINAAWIMNTRVGEIMQRSKILEDKLNKAISSIADKGIDTTIINAKADEFSAKIESAKTKYNDATDKFQKVRLMLKYENASKEDMKKLADDAKELIKSAHQDLKDAHTIFVEIVKLIKEKSPDTKIESVDDNEVVTMLVDNEDLMNSSDLLNSNQSATTA